MKNQLNRELIEELNESSNTEFIEKINDTMYNLVGSVIDDISAKSAFIRADKCIFHPVNEIYTGAVSQLSEYTYFLGIENPEIEFNSKKKRNFWANLWREFRASWRLGKRKYRRQKMNASNLPVDAIDKYKLSDFRHDVVNNIANYLTESSIVYEYRDHISIIGSEDFGTNVRINIYICCFDSKNKSFKLYNESRNKFFEVKFGNRFVNIQNKTNACGQSFCDMIKIFNAVYSKSYNAIPNQIVVESLIYSCPNVLFDSRNTYQTFINVANYIRIVDPKSFMSVCDETKNIFDDPIIVKSNAHLDFGRIVTMLDKFKY